MKNEEIYDSSRNVQNGDPSIKTEMKDDKDDSKMNGVLHDYIGNADMNVRYDADSNLNNKPKSTLESRNNLNDEYKYVYDNEVLASQEIKTISKIMKSKNMSCAQNASPENNFVHTSLPQIEGDESVGINQSGSFKSANNLNISYKLNCNDTEVGDYMYDVRRDSDVRRGRKSFQTNEVHREKIKTDSSHTLEESNMDGEGPHTYLSAQRGYICDESVSNQHYVKMQYKEMKGDGKEYLHFYKREKDDEQGLSECRGVDADFDAVESDINYYDEEGLRLDYEADQNDYQNYEAQKSVDKSEEDISDAPSSPTSEQGEKKILPIFKSNVDKTNGLEGIIANDNPTYTQVHNDRSNDSGLYRDGSNASLSGPPCANDSRDANNNGNEKEALDDVTWRSHKNDKEGTVESDSGDQSEDADNATSSLIEVDKSNEGGENGHVAYVRVEKGKDFQCSEQKVGHEKNVENDLSVTRMKSSSDDAEQKGEYGSNVTTVNSPPKEGRGNDYGEDGATTQEQKGIRNRNTECVRSKDNPREFKVTMLSNTNGKDNKDSLYSYMKASNTMDDTITSTISDNANEYELVEDGSEEKNEKEDPQIESENVQMGSPYYTVANNNKRRRDSFSNDEMNKERKLNSQNAALCGPHYASAYASPYASPYAPPEENANKTFILRAHGESHGEQKGDKTSYESCSKDEQYVNPQQGDQNKPGGNFVSYSKENLGGVIFVNRENITSVDPSYDNGKSFTIHRTFDKANVVEKDVQENVNSNGAYVPTHPQANGVDSGPNCKVERTDNFNDAPIEDNANGYSEHIQVSAKSVKDNCDEYIDMDNENNNLSDDCKNSSDDNMEKKDSSQFDGNDKKKIKPDSETLLPIANISRIMKRILPASAKVAKESKDIIRECVTEFIQFLTSEASDRCLRERRKTINGEDILFSMEKLGFNDYVEPLCKYLTKWKQLKGMSNSSNCQEKKCEGSKLLLEQNATMKKSLSDVNMNSSAIVGKEADNVILTKDSDHLMNNMYRNPNEIFENNINHME
ncbi:Ccaat-box dna binding protein subunit b [Plasmodium coatneyi]|uniref:Ccaat-box dna binding protein subunit b n=1 Tax=Plasmodium coatneyi TaxID=208452 RepID=A0A1B1E084_9APIC|nr:Ccaat-box dna binding protein subunit b [Plasmodium coatneyi]ANQ08305.1 Ccaat-box dna binding protein subunit b [Plasmodium coatneyi]